MDDDPELVATLHDLATWIAAYSNPHMHYDLSQASEDEINSELEALKNLMREMIG